MKLVLMAWRIDKLTNQLVIQTIHAKLLVWSYTPPHELKLY